MPQLPAHFRTVVRQRTKPWPDAALKIVRTCELFRQRRPCQFSGRPVNSGGPEDRAGEGHGSLHGQGGRAAAQRAGGVGGSFSSFCSRRGTIFRTLAGLSGDSICNRALFADHDSVAPVRIESLIAGTCA